MNTLNKLTNEEKIIANRIENYFSSKNMPFKDKIFNAILIAQHELEAQHFSNESEKQRIIHFKTVLENILQKYNFD